jgi:hypothetical protein
MFPTPVNVFLTRQPRLEVREAMWTIFRDFHSPDRDRFMICYEQYSHFALYFAGDQLVGFTGLCLDLESVASREAFLIRIGQTHLLPEYQNRFLVLRAGLRLLWRFRRCWWRHDTYLYTNPYRPGAKVRRFYLSRRFTAGRRLRQIQNFLGEYPTDDPGRAAVVVRTI